MWKCSQNEYVHLGLFSAWVKSHARHESNSRIRRFRWVNFVNNYYLKSYGTIWEFINIHGAHFAASTPARCVGKFSPVRNWFMNAYAESDKRGQCQYPFFKSKYTWYRNLHVSIGPWMPVTWVSEPKFFAPHLAANVFVSTLNILADEPKNNADRITQDSRRCNRTSNRS